MNRQLKRREGVIIGRGIQWTDYTWNPIGGCKHACRWVMPDGTIAICYSETTSITFPRTYAEGFEHHYWRPHMLQDPVNHLEPARIFLDSMSDLMGAWVPEVQIKQVLDVCRNAPWHDFQLLTKNPGRLTKFDFPENLWVGVSSPPDFMKGNRLSIGQQEQMLAKSLRVLADIEVPVRWMSIEPLSWKVSKIISDHAPLSWAVIGAATNGRKVYQPLSQHVADLLEVFDKQHVPVFFKGNLWGNPAAEPWREYFPNFEASPYMAMRLDAHAVPAVD